MQASHQRHPICQIRMEATAVERPYFVEHAEILRQLHTCGIDDDGDPPSLRMPMRRKVNGGARRNQKIAYGVQPYDQNIRGLHLSNHAPSNGRIKEDARKSPEEAPRVSNHPEQ